MLKQKKLILVSIIVACILLINYLTETIALPSFGTFTGVPTDLSVICYNVKSKDKDYGKNQKDIAKLILKESPDVVFLCEFNKSVSRQLDSLMTQVGHYKSTYRKRSNSIFYSKYEIDSLLAIDVGTSSNISAINNIVHVYLPSGVITIVGCHLSSSRKNILKGYKAREREADSIYKLCINESRPLIVMGDFNDLSCSSPVKLIEEAGLKDAWWEGGCGYGATYNSKTLQLRLDHILYDDKKFGLVDVKVLDGDFSDHNALFASFKIKK